MTLGGGFIFPGDISALDEVVRQNLLTQVTAVLKKASETANKNGGNDDATAVINNTDRLLVSDRLGDSWVFRLVVRRRIPGLTGNDEPVALVSLQPEPDAWAKIRPSDFAADEELSRLIPALQYMRQNFAGESSLDDVAKTVHLSPFHFHRRFAELLGVTPKHYMFDCQIAEAKRLLVEQEKDLREVAELCGFAHQSHFTSRFKQATGLTPTAWRRIALGAMGTNRP
ncbi:MAG: AraC family transcriptional regulator, partial [Planctomycetota bacterium]